MARPAPAERIFTIPASCGWIAICATAWLLAHPSFAQAPQPQITPAAPAPQLEQQVQPPQPAAPQLPQQQEAPRKPEGFFDAIGRWWTKSSRDFKASVDAANAKWRASVEETNARLKASANENNARWRELGERTEKAAKETAAAQKEAADAFRNLAKTRMVEGRQICELAPNGSPDCQAAAEVICKNKGFAIGKSADITTTRKCSARALLQRDESECRTQTVVIKAACQ